MAARLLRHGHLVAGDRWSYILVMTMLYYAFAGPFVRRPPRPGEFGYLATSGLGGLLLAAGLLVLFEGVSVHVILAAASARIAWVHAAIDVYSILWLVAVYEAARLRPVAVTPDCLLVRTSLLWTAPIPRGAIAAVTRIQEMPSVDGKPDRRVLRAALGAPPEILVTLREPVVARGVFGLTRAVTAVALYVDDPTALCAALAQAKATA